MSRPSITIATRANLPLTLDQHGAHLRQPRDDGRRAIDFRRANRARDVGAVDRDLSARDVHLRLRRDARHGLLIVERHVVAKRLPADGAVHGAAVDVPIAEPGCDGARDGAFSSTGGTVDGDDQGFHRGE